MWYNKIEKKIIDNIEYKLCSRCNEWFPCALEYFYKNKSSKDSLYPYCKKCAIKKQQKWMHDNAEYYKQRNHAYKNANKEYVTTQTKNWRKDKRAYITDYTKQYKKEHPEKLKQYNLARANKNHNIIDEEWNRCKKYFNYECAYCGITEDDAIQKHRQGFHKEHIIFDGSNLIDNCVPACRSCNSQKWEFGLDEWYNPDNPCYSKERYDKIIKWKDKEYKDQ